MNDTRSQVLLVTHRVPFPPNRGDRIRTYHVLRFLAGRADVHLVALADEPVEASSLEHLRSVCASVAVVPTTKWGQRLRAATSLLAGGTASEGAFGDPRLASAVLHLAGCVAFDAVLVSTSALARLGDLPGIRDVPLFVDLMDVDSQKWLDYAAATSYPMRAIYDVEGRRLRKRESALADRAKGLFVVSEAEAELYRTIRRDGPIHAIANGVDLEAFAPHDEPGSDGCVFVGVMDYRPNVDAVLWFCEHVWPAVRERSPEVVFRIVGREPTRAVRALAEGPGIEVTGSVDSVQPYLAQAAVVVVPLRIARGVQNKLLEAMAMEKAIVSAPGPLQGLNVRVGEHLERAESPDEWIRTVGELLGDPERRQRLGAAAGARVRQHHTWEACLAPLERILPIGNVDTPGPVDRSSTSLATRSSEPERSWR